MHQLCSFIFVKLFTKDVCGLQINKTQQVQKENCLRKKVNLKTALFWTEHNFLNLENQILHNLTETYFVFLLSERNYQDSKDKLKEDIHKIRPICG